MASTAFCGRPAPRHSPCSSPAPGPRLVRHLGATCLLRPAALALCAALSACGHPAARAAAPVAAPMPAAPAPVAPPAPEAEPAKPSVSVSDVLSAPDKAWVFSFEGSGAYDKAKGGCDEQFKDNPQGRARCITKARDAFTADAMEFTRDDAGNNVWVIYRSKSNKLIKVYSVQIEYGEQQGDTLSIRKVGHETGKAPVLSGVSEFKVKLGGEYSMELDDAQHGALAYDARLGFITTK